jgi:hypothetical protein
MMMLASGMANSLAIGEREEVDLALVLVTMI